MRKPILLLLSLLLFAGIAFADNVVTYTYDSAGNRTTKVVTTPSKGSSTNPQSSPQSTQSGDSESPSNTQSE